MDDIFRLVVFYLNGIRRYRWIIVIVPALMNPVGWFVVATMPDQWEAAARVYVDTESVLRPLMKGIAVRLDDDRRIQMMTKLLFSRQMLEKLARMTDLDLTAKTPKEMDELVEDLKKRVKLQPDPRSNIYTLNFKDQSADLAKRVVQSFLTIFVETNLGESRKDQDAAEQFLVQETGDYEARLREAERKVKEFKARNLPYLSDQGGFYARLQQAKTTLDQAKLDMQIAENRRNELLQQIQDFEVESANRPSFDDGMGTTEMSPLAMRIQSLQGQLDDLLIRYTERHPEAVALRAAIDRLVQEQQGEETLVMDDGLGDVSGHVDMSANPVYQQLRLLLSEAEAEMVSRRSVVTEYQRRIERLEGEVDRLLQVETEQTQLNRDYQILLKKHSTLVERLESLRLGRQVDTTAETVRFRVIEPPKVPEIPAGPNRILLSTLVFILSLAAGFGLAVLQTLLRPTFIDRKQLNEVTDLPVLGSINMIWTEADKRRRRFFNLAYAVSLSVLVFSYGAVITVYRFDIEVLSRLPGF